MSKQLTIIDPQYPTLPVESWELIRMKIPWRYEIAARTYDGKLWLYRSWTKEWQELPRIPREIEVPLC